MVRRTRDLILDLQRDADDIVTIQATCAAAGVCDEGDMNG
jgi:hypothetical protein